jgi:hypothetical protein
MVLDTSSTSNSDPFADSAPSSDSDPYSESQPGGGTSYQIDKTNFPKPIPIIGPLVGYNDEFYSKVLTQKMQVATNTLGRPLTQDEATAFAFWAAKSISIFSYGAPLGIAAGWWRCYNSRETFRFPFYQPNLEKFQPDVFPPRLGTLTGMRAVIAWHGLRTGIYSVAGMVVGQILFASYAASVVGVGEVTDKRLKSFVDAVRAQSRQKGGSLPGAGVERKPAERAPPSGGPAGTQYDRRDSPQADDASPTGGIFWEENAAGSSESVDGTIGANTQTGGRPRPPVRPAPAQMRTQEAEDRPFDAWDDASPAGRQGSTAPQGSAWDRLRRGEKPAPIPQKSGGKSQPSQSTWSKQQNETQKEQTDGSTTGDSFAFSKSEEEKNYVKEEAQKEFDARVERERRGGDFSQGGGDQRRW